jgi:V/A-type H+/Na+-transporting ATPase subunit I
MSIINLKKISFFGPTREKESILDKLQSMGGMHLTALGKQSTDQEQIDIQKYEHIFKALKYLQSCPKKRHQAIVDDAFNLKLCVERVLQNQRRSIETEDQYKFLRKRIASVEPWGDFQLPKIDDIGGFRFWFYKVPVGKIKYISTMTLAWQIVYRNHRHAYIIVIAKDEPPVETMPAPRVHIGSQSLSQLRKQLIETAIEIEDLCAERESLTRWILMIGKNLAHIENAVSLTRASGQTMDREDIFIVQGWVPGYDVENMKYFSADQQLAMIIEDPVAAEMPPTLLKNSQLLHSAEDLVNFYQTPGYRSYDPSLVLFLSFSLFFAMILGDAGYALLLGLGLLLFWRPMGRTEPGRSMRSFFLAVTVTSIVWGALMGSYFGLSPAAGSLISSFKVFDIQDTEAMMQLSIFIGVLHLVLANGCKAWHCRRRKAAFVPMGWIAVIIGGSFVWLHKKDFGFALNLLTVGWVILGFGLLAVFLFSSERTIKRPIDFFWRILEGAKGLTKVTKVFGDLLSYLRLFALGLASSSLAIIFNHNAAHALREQTGMNILNCLLIWITGHTVNLMLCLMSGIVHGLRLNFIEYFSWSISEEGYPFKAFSKKEIQE